MRSTRKSTIASCRRFVRPERSRMRQAIAIVVVALMVSTTASAQTYTGSVSGVVKDQQGGVLPGVNVMLVGKTGTRNTTSDSVDSYRFPAVEAGSYSISAELTGFKRARQDNVNVTVGSVLDIPLS